MNWNDLLEKLTELKDESFMNEKVKAFCDGVSFETVRLVQDLGTGELLLVPEEAASADPE
jgi:hypothetical protein